MRRLFGKGAYSQASLQGVGRSRERCQGFRHISSISTSECCRVSTDHHVLSLATHQFAASLPIPARRSVEIAFVNEPREKLRRTAVARSRRLTSHAEGRYRLTGDCSSRSCRDIYTDFHRPGRSWSAAFPSSGFGPIKRLLYACPKASRLHRRTEQVTRRQGQDQFATSLRSSSLEELAANSPTVSRVRRGAPDSGSNRPPQ